MEGDETGSKPDNGNTSCAIYATAGTGNLNDGGDHHFASVLLGDHIEWDHTHFVTRCLRKMTF